MLPLDILKIIFNNLDFKNQINMISSCNYFRNHLFITDLYNIERKYLDNLTTDILKYSIFSHVVNLDAGYNNKITNVSFMTSLKKLNASYDFGIDQNSIIGLNLVQLVEKKLKHCFNFF